MNNIELYQSLFFDSLTANLFFALDYEYVIWIINLFGRINNFAMLFIAAFGYMLSLIFNYLFGMLFYKIFAKYSNEESQARYKKIKVFANNYWILIIFFSIFPGFGKFMFLFLGFLNVKPAATLIFGTLLKSLYYTYYLI